MSATVALPDRFDLSSAPEVANALLKHPAEASVVIDVSQTSHFGALGLQVVMAAAIRSNAAGGRLELRDVSDRVLAQMTAMGTSPEQIVETTK
ncbi:MAG: STAS domain-containing protein [Pseudomonadota bacterium]